MIMKNLNIYLLLIIISHFIFGCKPNENSNIIWIGSGFYYYHSIEYPNPNIIDYNNQKIFNLFTKKERILQSIDTLQLVNKQFVLKSKTVDKLIYSDINDSNLTASFYRAKKTDSKIQFKNLSNSFWREKITKKKESFDFINTNLFKNGKWKLYRQYCLNDKIIHTEEEEYSMDTLSYNSYKFVAKTNEQYYRVYQLIELEEKYLTLFCNDTYKGSIRKLYRTGDAIKSNINSKYTVCNEHRIDEYFNREPETKHKGGKRYLEKYFLEKYSSPYDTTQNGYIRIRFIVNCNEETGRFSIQQTDINYKEIKFKYEIASQLFLLTKSLTEWINNSPNKRESNDTYKHLTFKIKNGQIEEILP